MPRLPNLNDRSQVPETLREAYDQVAALRGGSVSGPYGVLLQSPEIAMRAAALGNFVRWHSDLTPEQREIAVLTTARATNAAVMWASHVRLGREAGVREKVIDVIGQNGDRSILSDEEAEIIDYVEQLMANHRVDNETFAALHARLGDVSIVDLTGLVGYYAFVGTVLNAFEIEPPVNGVRLPNVSR